MEAIGHQPLDELSVFELKRWLFFKRSKNTVHHFARFLVPELESLYQSCLKVIGKNKKISTQFSSQTLIKLLRKDAIVLLPKITKFLVVELHNLKDSDMLSGNSVEMRFDSFIDILEDPEFRDYLFSKYPLLKTLLSNKIRMLENHYIKIIGRLASDWREIEKNFHINIHSKIHNIEKVGDPHHGGEAVSIVTFKNSTKKAQKILYKPRSMGVDVAFNRVIHWFNEKSDIHLKQCKIIDKQHYGWSEFIHYECCHSEAEIQSFYRRVGALLMLLYWLGGADFHVENLIANGDSPVVIDLECMLQPRVDIKISQVALLNSVLSIGFLPWKTKLNKKSNRDISAITGVGGERIVNGEVTWDNVGTENMQINYQDVVQKKTLNIPKLLNRRIRKPAKYQDFIIDGFTEAYAVILENQALLLSRNSPVKSFKNTRARYLFRNTGHYRELLNESFHPDILLSQEKWDEHFSWLRSIIDTHPYYEKIIQHECEDIKNSDIPYFTFIIDKEEMFASTGELIDVPICSGYSMMLARLKAFSQEDMKQQVHLIKASFLACELDDSFLDVKKEREAPFKNPKKTVIQYYQSTEDQAAKLCKNILGHLDSIAYLKEKSISWPIIAVEGGAAYNINFTDDSLFTGHLGIMLTYYYAGIQFKDKCYTAMADQCYQQLEENIIHPIIAPAYQGLGAHTGIGGILYSLGVLDRLSIKPFDVTLAESLLRNVDQRIIEDTEYDLLSGASGLLVVLCLLDSHVNIPNSNSIRKKIVTHLLEKWPDPKCKPSDFEIPTKDNRSPLGFAHGIAGVMFALSAYHAQSPTTAVEQWISGALDYLLATYDKCQQFPDFQLLEDSDTTKEHLWCRGFSGIAQACIGLRQVFKDERIERILDIATRRTLDFCDQFQPDSINATYCCGYLGANDLIINLYRANYPLITDGIYQKEQHRLLTYLNTHGIMNFSIANGIHTPLNQGVSGTAYHLLRLCSPDNVPTILGLGMPGQ